MSEGLGIKAGFGVGGWSVRMVGGMDPWPSAQAESAALHLAPGLRLVTNGISSLAAVNDVIL
jgi:hypothetical protein